MRTTVVSLGGFWRRWVGGWEVREWEAYEGTGDVDTGGSGAGVVEPLWLLEAEESVVVHDCGSWVVVVVVMESVRIVDCCLGLGLKVAYVAVV